LRPAWYCGSTAAAAAGMPAAPKQKHLTATCMIQPGERVQGIPHARLRRIPVQGSRSAKQSRMLPHIFVTNFASNPDHMLPFFALRVTPKLTAGGLHTAWGARCHDAFTASTTIGSSKLRYRAGCDQQQPTAACDAIPCRLPYHAASTLRGNT
jgi:hypothetical protein